MPKTIRPRTQARRRSALAAALVLAGAIVLVLWTRPSQPPPRTARLAEPAAESGREPAAAESETRAASPSPPARESVASAAAPVETVQEALPSAADPPPPRDALGQVHLLVQDRLGAAISGVDVRLIGLRTSESPGSHYGVQAVHVGRSAQDGAVTLSFPVWVNDDLRTASLTLELRHPEYEPRILDNFEIAPEPRVVVLERGAFLVVSGWIDDPARVVRDVVPHLTDEARVTPSSWLSIRDGRPSNGSIPAGAHVLWLEHRAPDGALWFSAPQAFTLERGEQQELHLELVPARTLECVLEVEVPRPVVRGEALLCLQIGSARAAARTIRRFKTAVRADGSFTFEDLPPGDGQMIALCAGWVSERIQATPAHLGLEELTPEQAARALESLGERARIPQPVDPAAVEGVFELLMEPTATFLAVLTGPGGEPVEGATLSLWPNVFWKVGYSSVFLGREYSGVSDHAGRVLVADLPAAITSFSVRHPSLGLVLDKNGNRHAQVELRSGETSELALELVSLE